MITYSRRTGGRIGRSSARRSAGPMSPHPVEQRRRLPRLCGADALLDDGAPRRRQGSACAAVVRVSPKRTAVEIPDRAILATDKGKFATEGSLWRCGGSISCACDRNTSNISDLKIL